MTEKYLSLPVQGAYRLTEGWIYSKHEQKVHGHNIHGGIDFAAPRGTPVLAADSGWAISSYHSSPLIDPKTKKMRRYRGKEVRCSLGYFVQIFHPSVKRCTQYGHLERISETIPFAKPRRMKDGRLIPIGHKVRPGNYNSYTKAVWVNRSDVIGYIGDSGLSWGYTDYPVRPDPKQYPSWDETHVHLEEFIRDSRGRKKQRDPYDLYGMAEVYPSLQRKREIGRNHLWKTLKMGLPL